MDIAISENLKKIRRQKGNTQQELADHLGISMQAVSKWECGDGFPDITLIPAIALYYNVTTDRLFGMDEEAIGAKIKEYEAKSLEISQATIDWKENNKKQIALWREAQKEFPNDHKVLKNLFFMLNVPLFSPRTIDNFDEIVQIGERLLAESTDNDTRLQTINILCDVYANEKDFETAKKYADMLPSCLSGREMSYGRCLAGEERISHYQKTIRDFIVNGINSIIQAMTSCDMALGELVKVLEFSYKLWRLLYSDGDFGYYVHSVGVTCLNLASFHSSLGNTDEALCYFGEAADHFVRADQYSGGEFKYTSPMVNRLTDPESQLDSKKLLKTNVTQYMQLIEDTRSFDRMRNDGRYTAAMEKMQAVAKMEEV